MNVVNKFGSLGERIRQDIGNNTGIVTDIIAQERKLSNRIGSQSFDVIFLVG